MNPASLFIEIGQSSAKILDGEEGLELPLERQENGRLTPSSKDRLKAELQGHLKSSSGMPRRQVLCAIGARGVSLRRMTLPNASGEELDRLLQLQIESEFPLSPAELAWGCRKIDGDGSGANGGAQELAVFAVKREVVEDYAELLSECGLSPAFTVGALARASLCPRPQDSCAMLDIGRHDSELILMEKGVPVSIRIIPWGGENLVGALENHLKISRQEAERVLLQNDLKAAAGSGLEQLMAKALQTEAGLLAKAIRASWGGRQLYFSGRCGNLAGFDGMLAQALGSGMACERVALRSGKGVSATTLGLQRTCQMNGSLSLLTMPGRQEQPADAAAQPVPWRWLALAALLALGLFATRYAEGYIQKTRIEKKTAELKAYKEKLPLIERELGFLQYLKTNQPAYLDAIQAIASAAPQGTAIESITLNRRGDMSLRGSVREPNQALNFRSKLNSSDFFSTVVAEEQTPTPDRQKIIVRISARWNPYAPRDMTNKEPAKQKSPMDDMNPGAVPFMPPGGSPEPMMMPPGALPPGVTLPPGVRLPPGVTLPPGALSPGAGVMPPRGGMPVRSRMTPPEGVDPVPMPPMIAPQ
jgi:Tfp pilus assembly PilM family ATPase